MRLSGSGIESWENISIGTWALPRWRSATHDHGLGLQLGAGLRPAARGCFNRVVYCKRLGFKLSIVVLAIPFDTPCPRPTSNIRFQPSKREQGAPTLKRKFPTGCYPVVTGPNQMVSSAALLRMNSITHWATQLKRRFPISKILISWKNS